jgi:diacylglycerol kinase
LVATAAVLVLELLNSMLERLVDLVKPRMHGYVRDIKDLMAAAVLVTAGFAAVVGLIILLPYAEAFLASV